LHPRTELLVDPLDDGILGPRAVVVLGDAVDEEEDGGESLDVVLLGEVRVLGGVDLGESDVALAVVGRKVGRGGGVVRGELLAVAAPGGVELDHDVAGGGEEGGEVGGGEDDDVGLVDLRLLVQEVLVLEEVVVVAVVAVAVSVREPSVGVVVGDVTGVVDEVLEILLLVLAAAGGGAGGGVGGGGKEEQQEEGGERSRGHGWPSSPQAAGTEEEIRRKGEREIDPVEADGFRVESTALSVAVAGVSSVNSSSCLSRARPTPPQAYT
jgi:hypothetical protein